MAIGTVWASGSWANPSWASGAWANLATEVELVESPTFVRRMHRVGTAWETLSIVGEQLLGRGRTVQALSGCTVTLTVVPVVGGAAVIDDEPCTVNGDDTVDFVGTVPDTAGAYHMQYKLTTGDRVLYFPDYTYATLTVIPALD